MEELKTGYSRYDRDELKTADKMRIDRNIYFNEDSADISTLTALPLEQLQALREESTAAEQTIFEALQGQAAAWEQQAGKTLLFEKAIEYARTPEVKHTANQWEATDYGHHIRSNRVYQMRYHVYENTRYDRTAEKSVPYSYSLSWSIYTNSPDRNERKKIAGQDKKVFADKTAMEKYLNGRIKAHAHLFTEVSLPIPPELADCFKVNGQLLPGYMIEGEERTQPPQDIEKTDDTPAEQTAEPTTGQRKERETINEQFSILIDSRSRFETGEPGGVWLSMPTTTEQLHEAMKSVGITADNPQDFFINGYASPEEKPLALPYNMVCAAKVDELNFLASRIAQLDPAEVEKLNAAAQQKQGFENIGQLIDFTYNADYFVHIPEVHTSRDLGDYYLNKSGMVQMPEEWKGGVDLAAFGKNAAAQEQGSFTPYGYLVKSGDEWEKQFEGRDVPEEYRVMSFPQEQAYKDAAPPEAVKSAEPKEPRPVIPIVLTADKPAEKMKEITDRLEQGITELFDSEHFKDYLQVMSKFHNYSFNNTLLIAMQKPDASLIAGFNAWKNNFGRNVMKGQKGIKIIAPSPFKVKQEMQKTDPQTGKAIIGKDGKPVTEEKEVTIPAYRVVTVFDVSQTEGRELPQLGVSELTGDVDRYKEFFAALEKTSPVPVGFEKIEGGAHGYYHLEDKRIAIDEGMSELQTLKTAIHEIAHAKLHDIDLNAPKDEQPRVDRRTREVEAESVAYTVCQHYGLDTSDYSFGYVAGWSSGRELAELKGSLETIRSTAAEIINSIDKEIAELQKAQDKEQAAPTQEAPEQPEADKDTFSIYQLKGGDETRDLRFEPYDRLQATGNVVDRVNYELVYTAPLTPDMTLNSIYERFNIDHPKDFKGHSLSISDVIVFHQNAQDTAHYVDRGGDFRQVPEFLQEQPQLTPDSLITGEKIQTPRGSFSFTSMSVEQMKAAGYGLHHTSDDGKYLIMGNGTRAFAVAAEQPENYLKTAEQTTEQNYNMIDGKINNTPTVDELEAKVKAGETISLVDLADAIKADKERGKTAKPEKKPSIRAQLKADKEKEKKKPPKSKSQDLERS